MPYVMFNSQLWNSLKQEFVLDNLKVIFEFHFM